MNNMAAIETLCCSLIQTITHILTFIYLVHNTVDVTFHVCVLQLNRHNTSFASKNALFSFGRFVTASLHIIPGWAGVYSYHIPVWTLNLGNKISLQEVTANSANPAIFIHESTSYRLAFVVVLFPTALGWHLLWFYQFYWVNFFTGSNSFGKENKAR